MKYFEKFSPVTVDVYEPLRKLTSLKSELIWNGTYPHLNDSKSNHQKGWNNGILSQERAAVPRNRCVGCGSQSKSSVSEVWNVIPKKWSTQQCGTPVNSISKQSLTSVETWYSIIEKETPGIQNGLKISITNGSPMKSA